MDEADEYKVADISLAKEGALRVDWARSRMPVLALLKEKAEKEQPLAGMTVAEIAEAAENDDENDVVESPTGNTKARRCYCIMMSAFPAIVAALFKIAVSRSHDLVEAPNVPQLT